MIFSASLARSAPAGGVEHEVGDRAGVDCPILHRHRVADGGGGAAARDGERATDNERADNEHDRDRLGAHRAPGGRRAARLGGCQK